MTLVDPKEYIDKLWGKQKINEQETYRMMRYVLRVDYDSKVLLHNVVTGQSVMLDEDESTIIDGLPEHYNPSLISLIEEHFLVPKEYDEHSQVIKLRDILRKLDNAKWPKGIITHYTILPTTACNARCYYCFEQGCESVTMSDQTVDNVIRYITSHSGGYHIRLSWFGGEPTIAASRIDHICEGLNANGISYQSDITTNGYLLDEQMLDTAIQLWKLKSCMICVDGTEQNYNRIKAYKNSYGNAYERVMNNIANLIDHGIRVNLRMNFDLDNYMDFFNLVDEVKERFGNSINRSLLQVRAHPIFGEHASCNGVVSHASDSWFEQKIVELNSYARRNSILDRSRVLPSLEFQGCQAYSASSVTITPTGSLVRCPEQFGEDQTTGNVVEGITNNAILQSWKEFADLAGCRNCCLFPICQRINRCKTRDTCSYYREHILSFESTIKELIMGY